MTFIVATLACLSKDATTIINTKKQLGQYFRACDIPTSDSLSLSIAIGLQQRRQELHSITTKAALKARQVQGKRLGNTQNLTSKGRQK